MSLTGPGQLAGGAPAAATVHASAPGAETARASDPPERLEPLPFRAPFVVAGSAFVDVRAQPHAPGRRCSAGSVVFSGGGSGRNLAENLGRLGRPVAFLGAVGDDPPGRWLVEWTAAAGVDTRGLLAVAEAPTDCFVAWTRNGGAVTGAVIRSRLRDTLSAAKLGEAAAAALSRAGALVVEAALPPAILEWLVSLARQNAVPVCLELASSGAARNRGRFLRDIDLVKGNLREMAAWAGISPRDPDGARRAVETLLARGARRALATLGPDGALAATPRGRLLLRHPAVEPVDTAGAGDAFLAGLLNASADSLEWPDALCQAAAAAHLAIASRDSSPRELTRETLAGRARELATRLEPC